jgi:hypothetical protein
MPASSDLVPSTRGWIGRYAAPRTLRAALRALVDHAARATRGPFRWTPLACLAGTLPLAVAYGLQLPLSPAPTALFLCLLLLPAAASGAWARGLTTIALVFASHSVLAIALSAADETTRAVLPGAEAYHQRARHWIVTGENDEYDPAAWLPVHLSQLAAVALASYLSLGGLVFWRGVEQVDLMNYYVGRLLADSHSPATALLLGWHPWSLCRGVGMMLVSYEIVALSLERLGGYPAPRIAGRRARLLAGLGFLLLDALLKLTLMNGVRESLYGNLIGISAPPLAGASG